MFFIEEEWVDIRLPKNGALIGNLESSVSRLLLEADPVEFPVLLGSFLPLFVMLVA